MKKINFKIPVTIFKEGNIFVAYTPALDLSTSGRTFAQVKKRFSEAVAIFFEEVERMGTADEALTNLGWQKVKQEWRPLTPIVHEIQEFQFST
ncbi:MAG: hypothetical protein COU83_03035 [Candidatus Portnoybacteria bacterium CG10_big_fil_rev_8_21_14_0_10_40_22]|uniref:Type II toxin-antitoxin system HicB family antitoxin n=2 Tax=Candidatus Portnoyibacteriota TaxID=1817913 RepID=A0A2M8KFD1_9BACT|nr:MAG: hypothetical protein COY09_00850 [Candidatus Portnoybacteria bacterium CG_4_10_14_0_2_um_filter_39_11]PJE58593.1 MAG: hypothetical protein COU83_03035 [Candidatus Portnoybacteria bacterium CG10_big_fil_rev_8_21_14_0_10_40_22]